jgi:hypothetical protein
MAPSQKAVLVDVEKYDDNFDFDTLSFAKPKVVAGESDDVCVSKGTLDGGKTGFRIRVRRLKTARVVEGRKNSHTVFARANRAATAFMIALDARIVDATRSNVGTWFMNKIEPDLVEDYYRGSTATDAKHGVLTRFVVEGKLPTLMTSETGGCEVVLQLTGIQFRRQYYTLVWKVVSAAPTASPPSTEPDFRIADLPFQSDEEDEDDERGGEEEEGPSYDEIKELWHSLSRRLLEAETVFDEKTQAVRAMIRTFENAPEHDLRTLELLEERLADI